MIYIIFQKAEYKRCQSSLKTYADLFECKANIHEKLKLYR